MAGNINKFSERMEERLAQLRILKEAVSECGESPFADAAAENTDRMYIKLMQCMEELNDRNGEI